jgi:hypothetical protein
MYEHGTLYQLSIPGWPQAATQLVVKDDQVIRTTWLLEWLRGATTSLLHQQITQRGWSALALREATSDDCTRPDDTFPALIRRDGTAP